MCPAIFWMADKKPRISGDAISLMYTWEHGTHTFLNYWLIFFCQPHSRIYFSRNCFMCINFWHTCVTIDTIEQQNPPINAVTNMVSTDFANTVKIHDKENGSDIRVSSLRRPYCRKNPPKTPPNRAPAHHKRNERKNKLERVNKKLKLSLRSYVFKSWLMQQKKISTVMFLAGGNNIKRTTASFQSAYRTESCLYVVFFGFFYSNVKIKFQFQRQS